MNIRRLLFASIAIVATALVFMSAVPTESEAGRKGASSHRSAKHNAVRGAVRTKLRRHHQARGERGGSHRRSAYHSNRRPHHASGGQRHRPWHRSSERREKHGAYDYDAHTRRARSKTKHDDRAYKGKGKHDGYGSHGKDKGYHPPRKDYGDYDRPHRPRLSVNLKQKIEQNNRQSVTVENRIFAGGSSSIGDAIAAAFAQSFAAIIANPAAHGCSDGCTLEHEGTRLDVAPDDCATCNEEQIAVRVAELLCLADGQREWHGMKAGRPVCLRRLPQCAEGDDKCPGAVPKKQ